MTNFTISKEQARQFAIECFDAIIRDIQATENKEAKEDNNDDTSYVVA